MTREQLSPGALAELTKLRKGMPLFNGCLQYFPDALLAVAEHSRKGNDKHNPGQSLHWSKHKSSDHADCIARHLVDIGPEWTEMDPEFDSMHCVALAWRALALAQIAIEAKRKGMKVKDYLALLKRNADIVSTDAYSERAVKALDAASAGNPHFTVTEAHCMSADCAAPRGKPGECGWRGECGKWREAQHRALEDGPGGTAA